MIVESVIMIVALIVSVIVHEVSHGLMALYLGDPTAKLAGRLTANPLKHIDPMGSVIVPLLLVLSKSPFVFGWAKPVPYNPHNLQKGGRFADALVAMAGPLSNLVLAFVFGLVFVLTAKAQTGLAGLVSIFAMQMIIINIVLALFNLLPIPPLDGSKILPTLLPISLRVQLETLFRRIETNPFLGFGLVLGFLFLFGNQFFTFVEIIIKHVILFWYN